ncbi:uncharacterized protein LOC142766107 [Rhipicephalus microplus]|uniref:uncharacterized protein LOC142766107 n=1 Tax=Rhipicephalus microplus TaxID=6941 RepID=UPI003F6D352D
MVTTCVRERAVNNRVVSYTRPRVRTKRNEPDAIASSQTCRSLCRVQQLRSRGCTCSLRLPIGEPWCEQGLRWPSSCSTSEDGLRCSEIRGRLRQRMPPKTGGELINMDVAQACESQ